ncbi:MAG: HlyD family efflux transporter periplasmic adaptor subunit [Lachnospiraceae bacterium]|nr:HlyD family efflux transporter periplasmic adaptor subunit [Lachnospiraceae bacterium]
MNKTLKRILVGILAASLTCGGVYGGLVAYRTMNTSPVKVISVSDLYEEVMSDPYLFESTNYTSGTVRADRIQSAFLSNTLTVKSVEVSVGDEVKKGDVLFTYDTTLTKIQYEKDKVDLEKKQLSLETKEKILERLKTLRPSSGTDEGDYGDDYGTESDEEVISEAEEPESYEPEETPVLLDGSGTRDDPYIYFWGSEDPLTPAALLQMFAPDGREIVIPKSPDDVISPTDSEAESPASAEGEEQADGGQTSADQTSSDAEQALAEDDEMPDAYGDYVDDEYDSDDIDEGVEVADENLQGIEEDETGGESGYEEEDNSLTTSNSPEEAAYSSDDAAGDSTAENVLDDYASDDYASDDYASDDYASDDYVSDDASGGGEYASDDASFITIRISAGMPRMTGNESETEGGDGEVIFGEDETGTDEGAGSTGGTESGAEQSEGTVSLDELREEVYIVLEVHQDDNSEAPVLNRYGLHLFRTDEEVAIRLYNPETFENLYESAEEAGEGGEGTESDGEAPVADEEDGEFGFADDGGAIEDTGDEGGDFGYSDTGDDGVGAEGTDTGDGTESDAADASAVADGDLVGSEDEFDWEASYTAEEIAENIETYTKAVLQARLDVRKAEIDLKNKKQELDHSAVYAQLDGVVNNVRDPEEAKASGGALVVVSGGGGYYVTAALGELDIDSMPKGTQVQVQSYYTNTIYSGTVESVSQYPTTGNDYFFGDSNANVSYYPAEIRLEEGAELRDDDYVEVTYSTKSNTGLFIDRRFIRTDGATSYVFVTDENGLLKKKNVVTGKTIEYSSYVQVRKGLKLTDTIAFPYGRDVFEGAKTVAVSYEEMYDYGTEYG